MRTPVLSETWIFGVAWKVDYPPTQAARARQPGRRCRASVRRKPERPGPLPRHTRSGLSRAGILRAQPDSEQGGCRSGPHRGLNIRWSAGHAQPAGWRRSLQLADPAFGDVSVERDGRGRICDDLRMLDGRDGSGFVSVGLKNALSSGARADCYAIARAWRAGCAISVTAQMWWYSLSGQ